MSAPTIDILRAFRIAGEPHPLTGGEGRSFRVGEFVLKPVEEAKPHAWGAELLLGIRARGFRVSAPVRAESGDFVVDGWAANRFEPGEHVAGRWDEKLRAIAAFHGALEDATARLSSPPMPPTVNRWARAHEIAWQAAPLPDMPPSVAARAESLLRAYRPLERGRDIVHSDACGNVLFADGLDPLVIDFSPTLGSRAYADAILVADAIAWEGAPRALAEPLLATEVGRQHILRAIVFRMFAVVLYAPDGAELVEREVDPFLTLARATST